MKKYDNFVNALDTLIQMRDVKKEDYDIVVYKFIKSGIINQFDKTFELSWKLMKELLLKEGIEGAKTGSPRDILKLAFSCKYFEDDRIWLEALKDRNNDSHIYDEELVDKMLVKIRDSYLNMFTGFAHFVKDKITED